MIAPNTQPPPTFQSLLTSYREVRDMTQQLAKPLSPEDAQVQPVAFVSPTKWHLAHTTWFFETFMLMPFLPGYTTPDAAYAYLYNSYYNSVGEQYPQAKRGLISRPSFDQIKAYRNHVDDSMGRLWEHAQAEFTAEDLDKLSSLVTIGMHHEQQHHELLLTDIKYVLSCNPLHPAYNTKELSPSNDPGAISWVPLQEGVYTLGHHDVDTFCFDNERPVHKHYLHQTRLANRLVTNQEYLEFIQAGGYNDASLWLSDGWHEAKEQGWSAPMHWIQRGEEWFQFTLSGLVPLDPWAPVCHVSYYEADAYATWRGARLPRESEWEVASQEHDVWEAPGQFVESGRLHPGATPLQTEGVSQMLGDVWEWTMSPYVGYPGYQPVEGALGEYNGKFMCNTIVLRGGSCATSRDHIRTTYRNFFAPNTRWQFSGIRLAMDQPSD